MPPKARESRENFEAGKVDAWSAGAYGQRVRVFLEAGKLKITYQNPATGRPKQRTLFAGDTPSLRKRAAAIAVKKSEELRAGMMEKVEREDRRADTITVFEVAHLYLQRAPGFPAHLFDPEALPGSPGVKAAVEAWYDTLAPSIRDAKTTPSAKTLWSDVYAFRRLFKHPAFQRSRKAMELEPADASRYVADVTSEGGSPRTPVNDVDRLSCAFRYVQTQHRRSIGLPYNPLDGRVVDRTRAEVPAYEPEEIAAMVQAARRGEPGEGQWQVRAAVRIAQSGRRRGAILALTLSDHDLEARTVTWEAEHAKGEAYGRGDETIRMTSDHLEAVREVAEKHPNPLGADAPLLWAKGDPSRPIGESAIDRQLRRLEKAAGVKHLRGRGFHGFCRSTITKIADALSDGAAAEFTGRTPETIRRYSYKKKTVAMMDRAADVMNRGDNEGEG